jgi:hypothetical protein
MARLRARAAIAALALLLIASAPGCGDKSGDGPPFEPGDIDGQQSMLITNGDIDRAGASTPYGVILSWWQALQLGDAKGVRRSYAKPIGNRETTRELNGFHPRFSQPIAPQLETEGKLATVKVRIRTVSPYAETSGVVSVTDFPAHFYLLRTAAGWRLRDESYNHYISGRRFSRLAVGQG